jgi:hypothetical protein
LLRLDVVFAIRMKHMKVNTEFARVSFRLDKSLVERLRHVAMQRLGPTQTDMVSRGIELVLKELGEDAHVVSATRAKRQRRVDQP